MTYNFKDTTGDFANIISQLYIRQAIAHLENQPGDVSAIFHGAAIQSFGPVPSDPVTPYTPANAEVNPYPFSPGTAAALLRDNGWSVVPGGTDTCMRPGAGAGECGAGIPAGTKLAWKVIYGTDPDPTGGEQLENLASEARQVGITMNLSPMSSSKAQNLMVSPKAVDEWAMAGPGGLIAGSYPATMEFFNDGGGFNFGGYADQTADLLISASVSSSDPVAVKKEAAYLTEQQPVLFLPIPDDVFGTPGVLVWKKTISGTPQSFEALTQAAWNPEYWFFTR